MIRSNRNNELLKTVSENQSGVECTAGTREACRLITWKPHLSVLSVCDFLSEDEQMFRTAHICVLLVGSHMCRLLWFVCLL